MKRGDDGVAFLYLKIERRPDVALVDLGMPGFDASSWQMIPTCSGSEAAMLTAQQAAIGARTCNTNAVRTIGRNFRNRHRIDSSTLFRNQLITQR